MTQAPQNKLTPAVRPSHRSNRWWFKLAATSFTIKLVLVIGLFLTLKWAAEAAGDEEPVEGSAAGAEIGPAPAPDQTAP